ncbi:MAG: preprotein translocase subunit SecE [Alphaproteobacteria bacterium]|nr:preprotein translocase subunit SecE [Alphaproteobacteria bacterium]
MKEGLNIAKWVRQVQGEMNKVTWPSRQETLLATLMVLIFSLIMSLFFLAADQVVSFLVRLALGA